MVADEKSFHAKQITLRDSMRPFSDSFSRLYGALGQSLSYGLAIALLCSPAIWNGFPLIHDDVGGYLARWPMGSLANGRSAAYGLLLWITRTTWWIPTIVFQSLALIWTVDRALKVYGLRQSPWVVTLAVAAIGLTSGAAFFVSKVMPDAWAAPAVLSLYLLAWHWKGLTSIERGLMAVIIVFAGATHMATFAVLAGLSCLQAAAWPLAAKLRVNPLGILFANGATWSGLAALLIINFLVAGRLAVTPGGEVFLFGRLVESGLVGVTLAEECPRQDWELCNLRNELPSTADSFLWASDSPLRKIGGWDDPRSKEEIASIISVSIRTHPLDHLKNALVLTARQIVAVSLDEVVIANASPDTAQTIDRYAPWLAYSFDNSRQQRGDLDVTGLGKWIVTPISLAGLCTLPFVTLLLWYRANCREATLPAMLFLALLLNASVCGVFSGPYARYQARLAWLAPFGVILVLLSVRRQNRREASDPSRQAPAATYVSRGPLGANLDTGKADRVQAERNLIEAPFDQADEQKRKSRDIELTILMPCLNEAKTIENCIAKATSFFARAGVRGEVLIADNGSTDESRALALAMHARVISVSKRGYGAALQAGLRAARGPYVILGDADDSYDFSNLDEFWFSLRAGYDLVIGNRFSGGIAPGAMSILHRLGNKVLSFVGKLFFRAIVGDFHCGLRGVNRDRIAALRICSEGMEYASEMVICATLHRYRIIEVPTTLGMAGRAGPSHLNTWRDGWRHLRLMLLLSPRWLFVYPGLLLTFMGAAGVALMLTGPISVAHRPSFDIPAFIVAAGTLLVGLQSISVGVVVQHFEVTYRLLPKLERFSSVFTGLTLERGLVFAGLFALGGLAGIAWLLAAPNISDIRSLDGPFCASVLVISLIGLLVALQLTFISFLRGVLDLPALREKLLGIELAESSVGKRSSLRRWNRLNEH
nr:glycosyltransferase family 2 protein [Bradyrhizobium diazoefficiens]